MNPSRTIYNSFSTDTGEFDTGRFVDSMLLFDQVLISSVAVLPNLIKAAGTKGTLQLLETGLLAVVGGGGTAQGTYDFKNPGFFANRPLDRPLRYGFETIFVDHRNPNNPSVQEMLERELSEAEEKLKFEKSALLKIRDAILPSMRIIDGRELRIGDDFRDDLKTRGDYVSGVMVDLLSEVVNLPLQKLGCRIAIREVSEDIYQIDSNLSDLLKIDTAQLHEILKGPFFEITGMNLHLRRMRSVNAAAGLWEKQAKILAKRIDFMAKIHLQSDVRQRFSRILDLADIPTLSVGSKFNVEELIKLREADGARSFRDWIQQSQVVDERGIQDLIGGWRRRLGEVLKTENANGIRFLVSTGLGTVLPPAAGIAASGIDYFLDKFLPGMGPIGFILGDYRKYVKKQGR